MIARIMFPRMPWLLGIFLWPITFAVGMIVLAFAAFAYLFAGLARIF